MTARLADLCLALSILGLAVLELADTAGGALLRAHFQEYWGGGSYAWRVHRTFQLLLLAALPLYPLSALGAALQVRAAVRAHDRRTRVLAGVGAAACVAVLATLLAQNLAHAALELPAQPWLYAP